MVQESAGQIKSAIVHKDTLVNDASFLFVTMPVKMTESAQLSTMKMAPRRTNVLVQITRLEQIASRLHAMNTMSVKTVDCVSSTKLEGHIAIVRTCGSVNSVRRTRLRTSAGKKHLLESWNLETAIISRFVVMKEECLIISQSSL